MSYTFSAQLYDAPLMKYQHLQEIKLTITRECHYYYEHLDHLPKPVEKGEY